MSSDVRYDLDLFRRLNAEWESHPLVAAPMKHDPASAAERAKSRVKRLGRQLELKQGQRVLEIGCGRGAIGPVLVEEIGVDYVGVDIDSYDTWSSVERPGVSLVASDIADPGLDIGSFDAAFSISVWEHIEHPRAALEAAHRLLRPGGVLFVQAQLWGGPRASHCYRDVYFPWPHLLFDADVFKDYYESIGRGRKGPAFINRWSELHYRFHVDAIGFERRWWKTPDPWFDEEFYAAHRERLSAYPAWDLQHDAIMFRVRRPEVARPSAPAPRVEPSLLDKVRSRLRRFS